MKSIKFARGGRKLAPYFLLVLLAMPFARGAEPKADMLRIGILPDADSLPLMVADAESLFAEEGVMVKLVPFQNPVERDAAFQAGAVDGIVGDILSAAFAFEAGFEVRITSLTDGRYGILSAPGSGIARPGDLKGIPIGLSTNTIIQYMTDTLLVQAGLARKDIVPLAVPKMPVRLELLVSGQLKAACLPEPLLTAAQQRGAKLLLSSDSVGVRAGVLIFTKSCIDLRAGDLAKMYCAYWKAASRINADNDAYRDFLVKKAAFPEASRDAYVFVRYHEPSLPSPEELSAVLSWMRELKLIKGNFPEGKLIDARAISGR